MVAGELSLRPFSRKFIRVAKRIGSLPIVDLVDDFERPDHKARILGVHSSKTHGQPTRVWYFLIAALTDWTLDHLRSGEETFINENNEMNLSSVSRGKRLVCNLVWASMTTELRTDSYDEIVVGAFCLSLIHI